MNIDTIPVNVEFRNNNENIVFDKGLNIHSVLMEIQHGLEILCKNSNKTMIDLGAIPLASFERNQLFEMLGQGEVQIHLSSLGESEIYETLFSGVWVIKHRDEQGDINAMFIEVCNIPEIILSQQEDVSAAVTGVQELIDSLQPLAKLEFGNHQF
ncbi:MAG: hydrogenase expression/formation protein [gamma proteobacterium symbiont of Taylorina sp.]|nr:hydrogenase expression/formation protein [gamma proteobacterium symbiont of Taylorina sp.]